MVSPQRLRFLRALPAVLLLAACIGVRWVDGALAQDPAPRWWKGNLHTHSLWSDGDDYPEMIADWYRSHGYHFLALSDHNVLLQGEKWIDPVKSRGGMAALERYRSRFGPAWVEERRDGDTLMVRLKPLSEFGPLFTEPDRFLMIPSEEISDRFERKPIHLNATNLRDLISPQGGRSVVEVMQRNVDAVLAQRKATGQPMFPHLNHPNFGWAITAEELMQVRGERFFEVYNGHPQVHNYGDDHRSGTERIWDIILTRRLAELKSEILYGLAVDDSHHYHQMDPQRSNPGRGWVVVRATHLTPEKIVAAMEAGDFYASTGVRLRDIRVERGPRGRLAIGIEPEPGVTYRTQFIGTRRGYDPRSEPIEGALDSEGQPAVVTRRYSPQIGSVLAEMEGTSPAYDFKNDEIYVRAKVISSKPQQNPYRSGDTEVAWVQPVRP